MTPPGSWWERGGAEAGGRPGDELHERPGQMTVPRVAVIVRKTYGMAYWNLGGSGCATDFLVAWPTAEMSFVDPEIAANVVFAGKIQDSPELAAQRKNSSSR